MKTKATRKNAAILLLFAAITGFGTYVYAPDVLQPELENDFLKDLKKKFENWQHEYAQDKIYLQSDKTLYEPGETIWLSSYLCDASTLKPSSKSDIAYVELIGPKGNIEKKLNLVCKKGRGAGDFALAEDAAGGIYKIRAYSNWMKNQGEKNYFEKTIQVQDVVLPDLKMKLDFEKKSYSPGDMVIAKLNVQTNENKPLASEELSYQLQVDGSEVYRGKAVTAKDGEVYLRFQLPAVLKSTDGLLNVMIPYNGSTESISRSVPIVLNKITFESFPEGGDLVADLANHLAFRATNESGKPADVEGFIVDDHKKNVCAFSSFHAGMGEVIFTPQSGRKYFAVLNKPQITDTFALPAAWSKGMTLHTGPVENNVLPVVINSSDAGAASIVMQVRGKVVYTTLVNLIKGSNTFSVSVNDFPAGVLQVTLFDHRNIERAERLVFVNRDRHMNIGIASDKQRYLPGEKVKLSLTATDENGLPVPARLSLSVVNDQLLSFADDRSGNILSRLLLEDELSTPVNESAFYFDRSEKKSVRALDLLMMTSGWRRFTWEQIIKDDFPALSFLPEKAIVHGFVQDGQTGLPLNNVKVIFNNKAVAKTSLAGKFTTTFADLSQNSAFTFECEGYLPVTQSVNDYNNEVVIVMYNQNYFRKQQMVFSSRAQLAGMNVPSAAGAADFSNQKNVAIVRKQMPAKPKPPVKENKKMPEVEVAEKKKALLNDIKAERRLMKEEVAEDMMMDDIEAAPLVPQQVYHRARVFPVQPVKTLPDAPREDFRSTIFWSPDIEISHNGKAAVEFVTSEEITSFRAIAEGMTEAGDLAHSEYVFYNQLPFSVTCRMPEQMVSGDKIALPVVLKNNTSKPIGGVMEFETSGGISSSSTGSFAQSVMPGEAKTILLNLEAKQISDTAVCDLKFRSCGFSDGMTTSIKIVPRGFPVQHSFSSQDLSREYEIEIASPVAGSLRASFSAYPNVVTDLLKGVDGILQEPYGCFEQTSCTAYPNAMVLDYLKHTGNNDAKLTARAEDLLNRGYKRLTTFETPCKGYEWFGSNPAHEGLTAYGIMEFVDMMRAGQEIDKTMLDRTVQWLMNHRDGKGGFTREQRALHDFGRISDDVLNGYIVYALSDAGYNDFEKEYAVTSATAIKSNDAYLLAMHCNAAYLLGKNKDGDEAMALLQKLQAQNGCFKSNGHSITYSQGLSLDIETTALGVLALINSHHPDHTVLNKAVNFIVSSRSGSGVFSSTQGTILALKSLTGFAKFNKRTASGGEIRISVDGKKVAEKVYSAGSSDAIALDGFEKYLSQGKHKIKVEFKNTKEALPYSLAVNWSNTLPASDTACALGLKTSLARTNILRGETNRLSVRIENKRHTSVPSSMALIGIPAGLSLQPWQLKELQEKGKFDYYELKGNVLALYYRGLAPESVTELAFDLKADIPGAFESPASCAYLYYNNEHKSWTAPLKVLVQ